ncbi:MAG: DUF192 domain-containing protein [Spirochaetes bacterium]|nr:DUF192 domain-containing protein [Spirochaetota bacterium]MBN2770810.1 DUF192 domain-containing protein [Spirochaetota bacterium]
MKIKFTVMVCLLALFPLVTSVFAGKAQPRLAQCTVVVINDDDKELKITAEIADTPSARAYGLMFREKLAEKEGMLFVFKVDDYLNFWMKNVTLPLSIAFIDSSGKICDIHEMKPLDASISYLSSVPVRYALEVNQGWFKKNNVKKGNRVILHGCISQ